MFPAQPLPLRLVGPQREFGDDLAAAALGGRLATQHLGDEECQLQGLLGVQPRVAGRLVAPTEVRIGDVLRPAEHSVTSSPVSSTWIPPGWVPSAWCTSKKPCTSSTIQSKCRVL